MTPSMLAPIVNTYSFLFQIILGLPFKGGLTEVGFVGSQVAV